MSRFLDLFITELETHSIRWCKGCDSYHGHRRGFADIGDRAVHLNSKICTRASLFGGLHEIGHIVANTPGMKRWEMEAAAEKWAIKRMREMKIRVPMKVFKLGAAYVARWKRFGRNVSKGLKRGK